MLRKYIPLILGIAKPFLRVRKAAKKHNKKGLRTEKEYYFFLQKNVREAFNRGLSVDMKIEGKENVPTDTNFLLVPNHQSDLDPVILYGYVERWLSFVTKKENYDLPLLPPILKATGCIPMDRGDLRQEIKVIREVEQRMKEHPDLSYCIFPEGTRSRDEKHEVHEFKGGSLKPAYRLNIPIVPVAIYGSFRVLDTKFKMKGYPVQLHFLKPIDPKEYKTVRTTEMARRIEEAIRLEVNREREEDLKLMEEKKNDIRTKKLPLYFKGL